MRKGHVPYGYMIENGSAVIEREQADRVRKVYDGYLSGKGYVDAAKCAGLTMTHSSVRRMLGNRYYLGDGFYPQLIDRATFDAAETERLRRVKKWGRTCGRRQQKEIRIPTTFTVKKSEQKYKDPYEQAAYMYSLIESEE